MIKKEIIIKLYTHLAVNESGTLLVLSKLSSVQSFKPAQIFQVDFPMNKMRG